MLGKSLATLWYRPGQKAVMTSHTAPMAPATPFFLLSEYQTPTILSSKSFRLLFPGNQVHQSHVPRREKRIPTSLPLGTTRVAPVGADDPGGPPPSYRPSSLTTPPKPRAGFQRGAAAPLWSFQGGPGGKFEIPPGIFLVNCTPFVRRYDILSNKWGVLLCQKEYQTC